MALTIELDGPADTHRLGRDIGELAPAGLMLRLDGPLGAGKTSLVQGVAEGLEVPAESQVRSPSFALVRVHRGGRLILVHADFYRLGEPRELLDLGLEEWLGDGALTAVEWADRFPGELSGPGMDVELSYRDDGGRRAALRWSPELEWSSLVTRWTADGSEHG